MNENFDISNEVTFDDMSKHVIFAYTREQALADGVLIDVSELAKEAGFRVQTVFTEALKNKLDELAASPNLWVDVKGMSWDILLLARFRVLGLMNLKRRIGEESSSVEGFLIVRLGLKDYNLYVVFNWEGVTIGFPEDF